MRYNLQGICSRFRESDGESYLSTPSLEGVDKWFFLSLPRKRGSKNRNRLVGWGPAPPLDSRVRGNDKNNEIPHFSTPSLAGMTEKGLRTTCCSISFFFLLFLLTRFSVLPGPTFAEQESVPSASETVHKLTLDDIIRIGIDVSPTLWARRYIIDEAEAQLREARAGRFPRMEYIQILGPVNEARGNVLYSPNKREDLLQGLGPFTRLELMVNQPLYTFGRLRSYIQAAKGGMEAKKASLNRFRLELVKTLKDLYYTLLLNEDLYKLVAETEKQFAKAVERAEELIEDDAGTLTQHELIKLRYGLARSSGRLVQIEKGRHLVHAALKRLLYLPTGEDLGIAEKRLKAVKFDLQGLEFYKETAIQNRPEWQELDAGILARKAELKAESRKYFPDFFISGIFRYAVAPNRDEQENPFAVEDFNYLLGGLYVGCRWELDFGIPHKIAQKRAALFTLLMEKKDAVSGMLLEVEKAYREVNEKKKVLFHARKSRKNGRAMAALSSASFHMGLGEAKDVFEAFGIYTEAAAEYYLAVRDFNVAVAELARVSGLDFLAERHRRAWSQESEVSIHTKRKSR